MSPLPYEELAAGETPLGRLVLRRRRVAGIEEEIYEVRLADDLLMSSLLTASERALADLSLPAVEGGAFEVLVGGLGLGYTAAAALAHERVGAVTVVELLPEVIRWHEEGLVPLGPDLATDPRCRFVAGDFFAALRDPDAAGLAVPAGGFGAVLVDIDHAPDSWLHEGHASFYGEAGPAPAAARIREGGVFGFWSSRGTDRAFAARLAETFSDVAAHEIEVWNPLVVENQTDTVYVARK